jgi:serine/threonine protein kinase
MKPIAPNTLIQNRYLIVHLIGKGGMGEVYLAVDQRLGSAIALKRTFFSDDATLGHAFEREARTLARLRHPVLPKVSDHFTEAGTQYLVMEHISGEDIAKRLETSSSAFPISWVLFWADQLLDALYYLHSHEPPIIHRDIKPQNLKLTDENHIVLLDFGLSKNSVGETRVTTAGSIVGYTPHYAPMEQIRGTGTDARSDIYSLSATLYQILTNTVPPDALSRADSIINGMPDPVKPISDLNPEVSRAVSDVIIKGMTISQEQRYKTAREMQKALRDAYAQMQTDRSANTLVFNESSPADLPQSPQKTAELSGVPLASQASGELPTRLTDSDSGAAGAKTNIFQPPKPDNQIEPNFDATMRYDSEVPEPSTKQSDVKTAVFPTGMTPAITATQHENQTPKSDDFKNRVSGSGDLTPSDENFAEENDAVVAENFLPEATVPLISFDKNNETGASEYANFDSIPERGDNQILAGAPGTSAESYAPRGETTAPAPTRVKSGKGLTIAGGIIALLVLAIAVAGIGWFTLRDKGVTTTDNAEPTPQATVSIKPIVEPSIAPTLEAVDESNSSTNSSTNSEVTTSAETNTSTVNNTINPTRPVQTPIQTTVQPSPTRPATTRPSPQIVTGKTPAAPVAKTPAPAKTPRRTDIEQ